MSNKVLCALLCATTLLTAAGCGKKVPEISGKYEAYVPVSVGNRDIGVRTVDATLPVFLNVGQDGTYTVSLGLRELKRDLNRVADKIERDGRYLVSDIEIKGEEEYEGAYEYKDGQYIFTGDMEFSATLDNGTLVIDSFLGEKNLEFK